MNDTIQIANDTLSVAISAFNGAKQNINNIDMWKNVCVLIVVAVIVIAITQLIAKICSQFHEKDMLKLNSEKEERKQLLDFCYEMAKKKESETKDFIKKTTTTVKTNTTDAKTTTEKEEKSTLVTNTMMGGENAGGNTENTITLDQILHECWQIIKQKNKIEETKKQLTTNSK